MAELRQFTIKVFVHRIKALLELLFRELAHGVVGRIMVHIRQEYRLRERRLDVFTRATVSVPACTDLQGIESP